MELRPYLIFPKLIEQPTWGGTYIAGYKGWNSITKKIGQSYELYGGSKLSATIDDSTSPDFVQESEIHTATISFEEKPLLIKFTQAKGNSFQDHKKPEVSDPYWLPKPESWYFFEDGYMSFGLKQGTSVSEYKKTCIEIDAAMQEISQKVLRQQVPLDIAREQAKAMILEKNPWQFVNTYHVPKFTLVDLSAGGLHHSWEEDPKSSVGNIVYEVQQDSPDETSTLRSFDQGKIKDDGSIRPLTIEEYFRFLDTDPDHNDVEKAKQFPEGDRILTTKYYTMDSYTIEGERNLSAGNSYAHLFVREGDVMVTAGTTTIRVTKGHSCYIPKAPFTVKSNSTSVILRTGVQ